MILTFAQIYASHSANIISNDDDTKKQRDQIQEEGELSSKEKNWKEFF